MDQGRDQVVLSFAQSSILMVKQQGLEFAPHIQSKAQTATYASIKDAIIQ